MFRNYSNTKNYRKNRNTIHVYYVACALGLHRGIILGGGGGGGGGTASLKVDTHCQTTASAFHDCKPLVHFDYLVFLGVTDNHRLKSYFLNANVNIKVTPILSYSISCNKCHIFQKNRVKIHTSYNLLPFFDS